MEFVCDNYICTGCGLCTFQCPKSCISMQKGTLGHLYPQIDQSACVDCGLCRKCCPSLHVPQFRKAQTAYAIWAKDNKEYTTSTSGGFASVLSRYIIRRGGVVYGAVVKPGIHVQHIRVDHEEGLERLKGSKYVQSDIVEILPLIKKDVKKGVSTLFIGTPCQVAAVNNLFRERPDNLILVDLICHGVPSLAYLNEHIVCKVGSIGIDDVKFRDGMGMYLLLLLHGEVLYNSNLHTQRYKDTYFNTFFDAFTYRESCYSCRYAQPDRVSDITIGDFWGLGNESPCHLPEHPHGVSAVLPMTDLGMRIIKGLSPYLNSYERTVSEAVNGNSQLRSPSVFDWRRKVFRKIYKYLGVSFSYRLLSIDKILRYKLRKIKNKMVK